jgi:hypothetical protein
LPFAQPSALSVFAFLSIVAFILAALLDGVYTASLRLGFPALRRTVLVAVGTGLWLMVLSFVVASGVVGRSPMPAVPLFLGASNVGGLLLALSPVGAWLARGLPLWALVGFQGFRLPLELVLHSWGEQGTIPMTMTWEGSNFDVITGLVSLVAAVVVRVYGSDDSRGQAAAWIANVVGFVLLLNVGRVAVLSSPLPFAWDVSPPLQLAFYMPYALIGPVCVAGALAGHVVLTRALLNLYVGPALKRPE